MEIVRTKSGSFAMSPRCMGTWRMSGELWFANMLQSLVVALFFSRKADFFFSVQGTSHPMVAQFQAIYAAWAKAVLKLPAGSEFAPTIGKHDLSCEEDVDTMNDVSPRSISVRCSRAPRLGASVLCSFRKSATLSGLMQWLRLHRKRSARLA